MKNLSLQSFEPELKLLIIDIDNEQVSNQVRSRYDLEVPKLAIYSKSLGKIIDLPRVPPRLKNELLFNWLKKIIEQHY